MSTLEKDKLVWVDRDKLEGYLRKHHVPETTRLLAQKIANMCFERKVEAAILFLATCTVMKNVKLSCYMPIYKEMSLFEQGGYIFEEIEGCIPLDPREIKNIRTIKEKELLFTIKDFAISTGFWREEYGIVALS